MTDNCYFSAMKRILFLFVALSAFLGSCRISFGQGCITTDADRKMALDVMKTMSDSQADARSAGKELSTAELMVLAAKSMLGTRYVAGTLDEDPIKEELRVYLTKTDCILFVETCLNLAKTVKDGKGASFNAFAANVAGTRYRCKPPYSYGDRIHYTTEWIRRQEGTLRDITLELGGEVNDHPIDFMSTHTKSYKQLADALFPEDRFMVSGYTDARGGRSYNDRLSHDRARAVYEALTLRGVPESRLCYRGFGESVAIVPENADDETRRGDRKVVIERVTWDPLWEYLKNNNQ